MKRLLINYSMAFCMLLSAGSISAQILNLGSISNFVVFTGNGAISNTGASFLTGDVGADIGAISLSGATVIGATFNSDLTTAQALIDLQSSYIQLISVPVTNMIHAPAFGSSEVLTTGVYLISGAGSLAGTLTLDGQGDPNAVFIFRFGGAFDSGAASSVILTNGTLPCNVFWISEGAVTLAASTIMKGTLLSHDGAVSMAVGCDLEGRMLSTAGAISFGPSIANLPVCTSTIPILPLDGCSIDLGSLVNFAMFTTNGAVGNTGTSTVTGDIGSDIGAISGFGTATVLGSFFNGDPVTAQAATDLSSLYIQLMSIPITYTSHTPVYGGGEVLTPGVYQITGAGSLNGNLNLDAVGDPDAIFIFRFGGAFSTAASSSVTLLNGSQACKIFWIVEGAITLAESTDMKGTLLADIGANSMAAGCSLEGHLFSTGGAISIDDVILSETSLCICNPIPLSIELISFIAACQGPSIEFSWETSSEHNNDYFTIQQSGDGYDWKIVSDIDGAGNSSISQSYAYTDPTSYNSPAYFRLLETNTDGMVDYHSIISLKDCDMEQVGLTASPNPSNGTFGITYSGNVKNIVSMVVTDLTGKTVYMSNGFESVISIQDVDGSIFLLHIDDGANTITKRLIILK